MLNHITNHSANQLFGSHKLLMHKKNKKKIKNRTTGAGETIVFGFDYLVFSFK